ncbi:hypothetical protein SAMN06272735_4402 [Streptomyces sp. TLI_55]|uniref:hypothetical protein n=1 Tax=Streptomyces sp. TLI_55 TaxID=1938861 RepID=UPI000BDB4275|nr:hypothetical protein [Streptomyces sp. TLI_55]SNX62616.1 hypothetical protein SAMN06272735_4402 [Streptomyces sp. TLI_55]
MLERTSTTERYARGVIAAVVAVAALVLAANAGPARAAEHGPYRQAGQVRQVEDVQRG